MPLIEIKVLRGSLTEDQKQQLVPRVGEAAIAVEGETRRELTELAPPAIAAGRILPGTP